MSTDGTLLSVNRKSVLPEIKLKDGDRVDVRFSLHINLGNLLGWLLPPEFVHNEIIR
jgi:hypothetical protein